MSDPAHRQRIFQQIQAEHRLNPISAVLLQETNIKRETVERAKQDAAAKGFQLFITPSRPNVPKGGGCAILVPKESIEAAKGEQHHDAIDRITKSVRFLKKWKHNYVSIQMTIDGTKYKLISAYAPQDKNERVNFMTDMTKAVTAITILGIDANCVPDVNLDLDRRATSAFPNHGAAELANAVSQAGLVGSSSRRRRA